MLFDLRSRGRRRTVQVVYLGLAVLLGGGLILFGVGTGSGGGLLNGLTGNGSNQQSAVLSSQETAALKQVKASPSSATAWGNLITARWGNASSSGYVQGTGYTTAGKKELAQVAADWQRYQSLTSSPDPIVATIAGRAQNAIGDYSGAANAFESVATASPTQPSAFQCLAVSAYAAKQTRKGDLALGKLQTLVPKAEAKTLATQLKVAEAQPSLAANLC